MKCYSDGKEVASMKLLVLPLLIFYLVAGAIPTYGQVGGEETESWDDFLYRTTGLPRTRPAQTDRTLLRMLDQGTPVQESDSGKININTASTGELSRLPRVGKKTAERIIEYRNSHKGFKSIREITNVSRIGDAMFESMKHMITVGKSGVGKPGRGKPVRKLRPMKPAAAISGKVNINTATREELIQLPWIGAGAADKIIDYRNLNGRISNTDELLRVPGFTPLIIKEIKDLITLE